MLCRKVDVIPIECIARGYITGSGWKDYQKTGTVCGIALPKGLRNGDRLPEPIFTPSTKAETGHDENISFDQGAEIVGADLMRWLSETTLDLYERAAAYAMERGIILADTKFEFGRVAGEARRCWSTKSSRPTAHASGPPTSGGRAANSRVSTSSMCATIWKRW